MSNDPTILRLRAEAGQQFERSAWCRLPTLQLLRSYAQYCQPIYADELPLREKRSRLEEALVWFQEVEGNPKCLEREVRGLLGSPPVFPAGGHGE